MRQYSMGEPVPAGNCDHFFYIDFGKEFIGY